MTQISMSQGIAMLAVLSFVTWPPLNPPSVIASQTSQLTGVVTDTNDARVANATVTITGDRMARTVTTSEDGTYRINLPFGIYRITVKSRGFCLARRAAFRIEALKAMRFDFTLVLCPIVNALKIENGRYKGETDEYQPPFNENEIKLPSSTPALKLFVQYGRRIKVGSVLRYEGFMIVGGKFLGVTASYNQLTVYADRLRFHKKTLRLEAEGNVLLDDGQQRVQGQRAEVMFKAGEPVVKLTT